METIENPIHETLPALFEKQRDIMQVVVDKAGEITTELENLLSKNQAEISFKLDNYARFIDRAEMEIELCKKEEKSRATQRRGLERAVEGLKFVLKQNMLNNGLKEITGAQYSFSIQSHGYKTELSSEESFSEWSKKYPEYFKKEEILTADRVKIKQDMQNGIDIPFARLTPSYSVSHERSLKFLQSEGD